MEQRFDMPLAIDVGLVMTNISARHNQPKHEAYAHRNLTRYYGALGLEMLNAFHTDKAISLFAQVGDTSSLNHLQWNRLEQKSGLNEPDKTHTEMAAMLKTAYERRDSSNIHIFLRRLIWHSVETKSFARAYHYIDKLANVTPSIPQSSKDYGNHTTIYLTRAEVAISENNLEEAEKWFQKTIQLTQEMPDIWRKIRALLGLADVEILRENHLGAIEYLNRGQALAEGRNLYDQLTRIYSLRAQISKSQGQYKEALGFFEKQRTAEKKWNDRSAGFNAQNYYLELEHNRIELDNKNTALELNLKKTQLRSSVIFVVFVLFISAGLFIGWFIQRKRKRELAMQNQIIVQQSQELLSLDAAKSRFFANVSHELRTPLTLIQGPIHKVLNEGSLSEQQTSLLHLSNHNIHLLQELVGEILDLQKIESSKMEVHLRPVLFNSFFRTLASQFESLATQRENKFTFRSTIDEDVAGLLDTSKCKQIINNLLSNAFKFTVAGDEVSVQLTIDNNLFYLRVSDSGSGISEKDLPHVFDRFFQTTELNKSAEGGTGIGLALCKEYARLFRGEISVKSTPFKNTTFEIMWPVQLTDLEPQRIYEKLATPSLVSASHKTPHQSTNTPQPTLLVVEDNLELQSFIRLLLIDQFNVKVANNGQEALQHISTTKIDLVVSDLMMPVMDGYTLLKNLKSDPFTQHIPVIMLTARADVQDKLKALRIGVDDYLLKPFLEEELLARIDNLLQNKASRIAEEKWEIPLTDLPIETDQLWLEKFENYVQSNLSDEVLTIPSLANEFAMSESTLLRHLKKLTGLTPSRYLKEARLDHARKLLERDGYKSITEIATAAGFSDSRSFSRSFKKRFGKLPTEINAVVG